jgi:hypothetical protein
MTTRREFLKASGLLPVAGLPLSELLKNEETSPLKTESDPWLLVHDLTFHAPPDIGSSVERYLLKATGEGGKLPADTARKLLKITQEIYIVITDFSKPDENTAPCNKAWSFRARALGPKKEILAFLSKHGDPQYADKQILLLMVGFCVGIDNHGFMT